jgi:hypothetical protein
MLIKAKAHNRYIYYIHRSTGLRHGGIVHLVQYGNMYTCTCIVVFGQKRIIVKIQNYKCTYYTCMHIRNIYIHIYKYFRIIKRLIQSDIYLHICICILMYTSGSKEARKSMYLYTHTCICTCSRIQFKP